MHFSKAVRVYTVNGKYMYIFASNIAALLQDLQSLSVSVSLKTKEENKEKKKKRRTRELECAQKIRECRLFRHRSRLKPLIIRMRPGPLCDLHRAIRAPWSGIRRIPRAFRRASLITRDSMFLRPPPLRPSSARPSLSFVPRTSLHWQNSREPRRSSLIFSHPEKSN